MERPVRLEDIDDYFLRAGEGNVYEEAVSTLERLLIEKALERAYGNQITAARLLGLNRNTIRAKIRKLGIDVRQFKR
jgi:two-component system nitrogen regulation response regulator GlnG